MRRVKFLIRWQIIFSFGMMLAFLLALGALSWVQGTKLWNATHTLHEHPLQVKDAAHELRVAVITIRQLTRDLLLDPGPEHQRRLLGEIDARDREIDRSLAVLSSRYLGPRQDVETLRRLLREWNAGRARFQELVETGKTDEAASLLRTDGSLGRLGDQLVEAIGAVETFAASKAASLLAEARATREELVRQFILFFSFVLLCAITLAFFVVRNFQRPLTGLLKATREFSEDNVVHAPVTGDEFGELAQTYNDLVDRVGLELARRKTTEQVHRTFAQSPELADCSRRLLDSLMDFSRATTGAVYLPDEDGHLRPFSSRGLDPAALKAIPIDSDAGEYGLALSAGGVLHLTGFPEAGPHVLPVVPGLVFPQEICTLVPRLEDRPVALISLGTNRQFTTTQIEDLRSLLEPIATGLTAIVARDRVRQFSAELQQRNHELTAQQQELAAQARELEAQNRELELQKVQLGEMNRLKTAFLSNMSHELRTPLNSVIALAGVLARRLADRIPAEEAGYIDIIERNGRHLLELINDVLDLARVEAGREEVHAEEFDPAALLREITAMLSPLAREKGLVLTVRSAPGTGRIVSDRSKLSHVLQNLVGNAIKFTAHGSVTITLQRVEDRIVFAVTDTGIGIPEEQFDLIFEEFRQTDTTLSRSHQGTGLGLAIARRYAILLGGRIAVSSRVGEGSEFTLHLPVRATAAPLHRASDAASARQVEFFAPAGNGGNRVLLIEDNKAAIIQIRDLLPAPDFHLRVATDGAAGLAAVREELVDAIILDLNMPGVDGFSVLKSLREQPGTAQIPILILTARHVSKEELSFLRENHIYQLIQKGAVRREELLSSVRLMLGQGSGTASGSASAPGTSPALLEPAAPDPAWKNLTALIVEDNPDNAATMKALLGEHLQLRFAADGEEALRVVEASPPDIVLLDLSLPRLDGFETLKVLRGKHPGIPVIAVTASIMPEQVERIEAAAFDGVVFKPVEVDRLFRVLSEVLHAR